jgi:polyisoprenoid-binding protein YceI
MNRARWTALAAVLIVGAVVGGYIAWDQVLRGDNVAPLAIASDDPSGSPSVSTITSTAQAVGTWSVDESSVVGYRVREQLASLPARSDAVGRTSSITGSATLAATGSDLSVTAAQFQADLTTLKSDKNMRDQKLHTLGLESDSFPTATFKLTSPVTVPASAISGATFSVTLTGDFTLHGVTRSVSIPAQARVAGSQIEIVGSMTFPMADYSITPPSIGGFVTVTDQATLEFDVFLDHA